MLTTLATILEELAGRIRRLSKRSLVGLFWSCATALQPEYLDWAERQDARTEPILREALTVARQFATLGREPVGRAELLHALEVSAPAGESADAMSATVAQDCWICADIAIRVLIHDNYDAGPAIEYALEPTLQRASEELFGVSQGGSGPDENEQVEALLAHPHVSEAVAFLQWATDYLEDRPSPSGDELDLVAERSTALAPGSWI